MANGDDSGGRDLVVMGGPSANIVNAVDKDITNAIYPELLLQQASISPPGNGMDRFTGQLSQGWSSVESCLELIFHTPYHSRVLRRWVGSFVPAILGDNATERVITRFFWAIATSIDLWEPRYRMKQVFVLGAALTNMVPDESTSGQPPQVPAQPFAPMTPAAVEAMVRLGDFVFRQEGVYYPAGHLGDFTPYSRRSYDLVSRGGRLWDAVQV